MGERERDRDGERGEGEEGGAERKRGNGEITKL